MPLSTLTRWGPQASLIIASTVMIMTIYPFILIDKFININECGCRIIATVLGQ